METLFAHTFANARTRFREYRSKCSKFLIVMSAALCGFVAWVSLYGILYELSLKEDAAAGGALLILFVCVIGFAIWAHRRNEALRRTQDYGDLLPTMGAPVSVFMDQTSEESIIK